MLPGRVTVVLVFCLLLLCGTAVSFASAADDGYAITPDTAIDTPEQTRSIDGESYTVDSMGVVKQGEELVFTVETPGVDRYTVLFYNSERQIETQDRRTEDGSISFETEDLDPGSYVIVLEVNGDRKAIQPVVVSGYDVNIDSPNEVTAGSSATVSATLSSYSGVSDTPEHVTMVVFNETWNKQYTATESGDTYSADIPDSLAAGEYSIYVTTHNDNEIRDRYEVTGLSSATSLTVTSTDQGTDTSESGGTDSSDSSNTDDSTETQTATSTPTTTPNDGGSETSDTTDSTPETSTRTASTDTPDDATPTETDDNVIEPATTTVTTAATTTGSNRLGFAVLLFVLLTVAAGVVQLRHAGKI